MDLQQILALAVVGAAAAFLVLGAVRRRKRAKFRECANCPASGGKGPSGMPGKT